MSGISESRAREILDENFFGIDEVQRSLGYEFNAEQLQALSTIPFSEEELEEHRSDHLLFAGAPLTIPDLQGKAQYLFSMGEALTSARKRDFMQRPCDCRWYLVKKETGHHGFERWRWPQYLPGQRDSRSLSAVEIIYVSLLYKLSRGTYLWKGGYYCISDPESVLVNLSAGGFCLSSDDR